MQTQTGNPESVVGYIGVCCRCGECWIGEATHICNDNLPPSPSAEVAPDSKTLPVARKPR